MTSDLVRPPEKRYNYPNAFSGLLNLMKEEGIRGLSRGLGTNTVSTHYINFFHRILILSVPGSFNECTDFLTFRCTDLIFVLISGLPSRIVRVKLY